LVAALDLSSKTEYRIAGGLEGKDCPWSFGGSGTILGAPNGLINLARKAYTILTLMSAFVRFSFSASLALANKTEYGIGGGGGGSSPIGGLAVGFAKGTIKLFLIDLIF